MEDQKDAALKALVPGLYILKTWSIGSYKFKLLIGHASGGDIGVAVDLCGRSEVTATLIEDRGIYRGTKIRSPTVSSNH